MQLFCVLSAEKISDTVDVSQTLTKEASYVQRLLRKSMPIFSYDLKYHTEFTKKYLQGQSSNVEDTNIAQKLSTLNTDIETYNDLLNERFIQSLGYGPEMQNQVITFLKFLFRKNERFRFKLIF